MNLTLLGINVPLIGEISGFYLLIGFAVLGLFIYKTVRGIMEDYLIKVEQGNALLISRAGKDVRVTFTGGIVWPLMEKAELMDISVKTIDIDRRGQEGLICKDNIRADIRVSFYVKVKREETSVVEVAQNVGCDRASDIVVLEKLFASKFSEALKTVGKQLDFADLYTKREEFRDNIIAVIGKDLNGYFLEDAAIDYLEQTPLDSLDAENVMDAEGIRKITELTSQQHVHTNKLRRSAEKEVKKEDTEAREVILELERQEKDKEAEQARLVATKIATEQAATRVAQAEEMAKAEQARIAAQEKIEIEQENKDREVQVAQKNRERVIAVENERVEKDRALEAIQRERETELRRIEKERDLEIERKNIQDVIAERVSVEKNVAQEEERIKELRLLEAARREKEAKIISAQASAEEAAVGQTRAAEANEIVARSNAKARLTQVEAEMEAADRQAQAKIRMAEGIQAERAAEGLAEARVLEAMAVATEKEGLAKARVLEARAPAEEKLGMSKVNVQKATYATDAEGTQAKLAAEAEGLRLKAGAEAEGIAKKAEAMKALSDTSQAHEEFRLKLENERLIAMEQIGIQKDIADSQAQVMAEAFRSANIDIVGGDGAFIDKIFQAASFGKSIDAFGKGGEVSGALAESYASGSRDLAGDIKDIISSVNSEDLRNLSLARLLTQMTENSSGAEKVKLKKVMDAVTNMGLADVTVDAGQKS